MSRKPSPLPCGAFRSFGYSKNRIVDAIRRHASEVAAEATTFVSHGGVGGRLLASLAARPIDQIFDQPGRGNYFTFEPHKWALLNGWERRPQH
jgi:hypothetical protein